MGRPQRGLLLSLIHLVTLAAGPKQAWVGNPNRLHKLP